MILWRRFRAMWQGLATAGRIVIGIILGLKALLVIGWLLAGKPIHALAVLATLVALVWFFGVGHEPDEVAETGDRSD